MSVSGRDPHNVPLDPTLYEHIIENQGALDVGRGTELGGKQTVTWVIRLQDEEQYQLKVSYDPTVRSDMQRQVEKLMDTVRLGDLSKWMEASEGGEVKFGYSFKDGRARLSMGSSETVYEYKKSKRGEEKGYWISSLVKGIDTEPPEWVQRSEDVMLAITKAFKLPGVLQTVGKKASEVAPWLKKIPIAGKKLFPEQKQYTGLDLLNIEGHRQGGPRSSPAVEEVSDEGEEQGVSEERETPEEKREFEEQRSAIQRIFQFEGINLDGVDISELIENQLEEVSEQYKGLIDLCRSAKQRKQVLETQKQGYETWRDLLDTSSGLYAHLSGAIEGFDQELIPIQAEIEIEEAIALEEEPVGDASAAAPRREGEFTATPEVRYPGRSDEFYRKLVIADHHLQKVNEAGSLTMIRNFAASFIENFRPEGILKRPLMTTEEVIDYLDRGIENSERLIAVKKEMRIIHPDDVLLSSHPITETNLSRREAFCMHVSDLISFEEAIRAETYVSPNTEREYTLTKRAEGDVRAHYRALLPVEEGEKVLFTLEGQNKTFSVEKVGEEEWLLVDPNGGFPYGKVRPNTDCPITQKKMPVGPCILSFPSEEELLEALARYTKEGGEYLPSILSFVRGGGVETTSEPDDTETFFSPDSLQVFRSLTERSTREVTFAAKCFIEQKIDAEFFVEVIRKNCEEESATRILNFFDLAIPSDQQNLAAKVAYGAVDREDVVLRMGLPNEGSACEGFIACATGADAIPTNVDHFLEVIASPLNQAPEKVETLQISGGRKQMKNVFYREFTGLGDGESRHYTTPSSGRQFVLYRRSEGEYYLFDPHGDFPYGQAKPGPLIGSTRPSSMEVGACSVQFTRRRDLAAYFANVYRDADTLQVATYPENLSRRFEEMGYEEYVRNCADYQGDNKTLLAIQTYIERGEEVPEPVKDRFERWDGIRHFGGMPPFLDQRAPDFFKLNMYVEAHKDKIIESHPLYRYQQESEALRKYQACRSIEKSIKRGVDNEEFQQLMASYEIHGQEEATRRRKECRSELKRLNLWARRIDEYVLRELSIQ